MRVTVEGYGVFEVKETAIHKLLALLTTESGVKVQESNTVRERTDNGFSGRELLNG